MAVEPQKDRLVLRSIVTHLRTQLAALGWSDVGDWLVVGNINDNPDATRPPVIGVDILDDVQSFFELGNSNKQSFFTVEVEMWGKNSTQLKDLKNSVQRSLGKITVYNASDVAVGSISPQDRVIGRVVDPINYTARVKCVMQENLPIVL